MSEDNAGSERRQFTRAPIELKVQYRKLNSFFSDYTENISKGGIFIKTPKPLPVGTKFLFKLTIPDRPAPFEISGEVRWLRTEGDNPGMGIAFIYPDDSQRTDFESVVESLMAEKLGSNLAQKLLNKNPKGS